MLMTKHIILCLACALTTIVVTGCDDPFEHSKCRTLEVRQIPSPDAKLQALVYEDSCKPDLEKVLATRVELRQSKRNEDEFDEAGQKIFSVAGKHLIQATWLDPTHLQIECLGARADEIHTHDEKWQQINISYKF